MAGSQLILTGSQLILIGIPPSTTVSSKDNAAAVAGLEVLTNVPRAPFDGVLTVVFFIITHISFIIVFVNVKEVISVSGFIFTLPNILFA